MKQNNKNAFTLIELMVVSGVISLSLIAIYVNYSKQQSNQLVSNQSLYLEQLSKNIDGLFASSNNLNELTPANIISTKSVPDALIDTPVSIKNLFGGAINFDNISAAPPTYGIILTNLPTSACAKMATTSFAASSQQVLVNGAAIKANGAVADSASIGNAAARCNNNVNTVEFINQVDRTVDVAASTFAPPRPRENPYYIPTIGNLVAAPPSLACAGGTAWTGSFCGCLGGTVWNGTSCIAIGSSAASCALSQVWNGTACVAIAGLGQTYLGGRYVPNLGYALVDQTTPGKACLAGNPGNYDGINCESCPNGSWNGFRCVAP